MMPTTLRVLADDAVTVSSTRITLSASEFLSLNAVVVQLHVERAEVRSKVIARNYFSNLGKCHGNSIM